MGVKAERIRKAKLMRGGRCVQCTKPKERDRIGRNLCGACQAVVTERTNKLNAERRERYMLDGLCIACAQPKPFARLCFARCAECAAKVRTAAVKARTKWTAEEVEGEKVMRRDRMRVHRAKTKAADDWSLEEEFDEADAERMRYRVERVGFEGSTKIAEYSTFSAACACRKREGGLGIRIVNIEAETQSEACVEG